MAASPAAPGTDVGAPRSSAPTRPSYVEYDSAQIALIKSTVAKGATQAELYYFLELSAHLGLNPFAREIWCFDADTEILTDRGFEPFPVAEGRVLEVRADGLYPTDSRPFWRSYDGDMVVADGQRVNFSATPTHDMLTTVGKVKAAEVYRAATSRRPYRFVRTVLGSSPDDPRLTDAQIRTAAAYIADGTDGVVAINRFTVKVSRPRKLALLNEIGTHHIIPTVEPMRPSRAGALVQATRPLTRYTYDRALVEPLVGRGKAIKHEALLRLSRRQARLFVDTWIAFDGAEGAARCVYMSRPEHAAAFEVVAVAAGYAVSVRASRPGLTERPNYRIGVSQVETLPANRRKLSLVPSDGRGVWCVTVPSGVIVVRRRGFSMLCGNCAKMRSRDGEGGGQMVVMVGRDGLLKVARQSGQYDGKDDDVVHENDTFVVERKPDGARTITHSYRGTPEQRGPIVGAWCEVRHRTEGPTYFFAPLDEYLPKSEVKREKTPWGAQLSAMVLKCAQSLALRTAFSITGVVLEEEMARFEPAASLDAGLEGVLRDLVPEDEALRERLGAAIARANELEPNAWGPSQVQMTLAGQPLEAAAQLVGMIEAENAERQARADEASAAAADIEAQRASGEPPPEQPVAADEPPGAEVVPEEDLPETDEGLVEALQGAYERRAGFQDPDDEGCSENERWIERLEAEVERRSPSGDAEPAQPELL